MRTFAWLVVAGVCAAGCRSGAPTADRTGVHSPATTGGGPISTASSAPLPGLPTLWRHEGGDGGRPVASLIEGTLSYDELRGCFLVNDGVVASPVVWPSGTTASAGPLGVVVPHGGAITVGDELRGRGGYMEVAPGTASRPRASRPAARSSRCSMPTRR